MTRSSIVRRLLERKGQALIEFILVLPILFLLILNLVNFGGFFYAWITVANAARAGANDIVITADIPLASRCIKVGAQVIAPNGKPFTAYSIGMTLAVRNLMHDLRSAGEVTGGPRAFEPRDRSAFLATLDQAIRRLQRAAGR